MKKILSLITTFIYLLFLSSCGSMKYKISYVSDTGKEINVEDIELIRNYIIEKSPNLNLGEYSEMFDYLYNVTPDGLENKCSIYHFDDIYKKVPSNLQLETFMIINNEITILGTAWGGWGVTEFAHLNEDYFYFIFSCGSGIHRSYITLYNFKDYAFLSYGEWIEPFIHGDISFCVSNGGRKLGVCNRYTQKVIYKDITKLEFTNGENLS